MGKTIKTKKGDINFLLSVWDKVPTSKIAADGAKYTQVRRALKKPIKKYVDERAEIESESRKKIVELDKKVLQSLREKLTNEEDKEKKKEIKMELREKVNMVNARMQPYNDKINNLFESIRDQEAEVVFDNEDFIYFNDLCRSNMADFCSVDIPSPDGESVKKQHDPEAMEKLLDFLEQVK